MRLGGVAKRLQLGLSAPTPVAFLLTVHICYIDESGTPEVPGNTSHFILAGLSIPIDKWKACDRQIDEIKALFVSGKLTLTVQIANLYAYALSRYCKKHEDFLFGEIFKIACRQNNRAVGVRHFTNQPCNCKICIAPRGAGVLPTV